MEAASDALSLDLLDETVRQGGRRLKLTPKAFAVLRHLMEHAGRLVTKDELLAVVWPDAAVTDASLTTCVREIRRTLNDDPSSPTYIQTVHRRGYRFTGWRAEPAGFPTPASDGESPAPLMVGRDGELANLDRHLRDVEGGNRRAVFVAGEPGIGKTALIEAFLQRSASRRQTRVARGQCIEQHGASEAYLPWLELLDRIGRDAAVVPLLRRYAPMWLAQLPWLLDGREREKLQREIVGTTPERMVRELAEALEILSGIRPLVLVLEDMHWSDHASIGLLSYVARRRESARILLLATYRPAEFIATGHPLTAVKQELRMHAQCEELSLDFLSPEAVVAFVTARLPGVPEALGRHIHQRTDGNPLFMISLIDYLVMRGAVAQSKGKWRLARGVEDTEVDVPQNLQDIIERQVELLAPADQRLLERASIAGVTFHAASLAAALEEPAESTEEQLWALARRGSFVRRLGRQTWPDGTQTDAYGFIHALYQTVLREKVGSFRQARVHAQVGARLEAGFGDRTSDIAAELALHFQRAGDAARAARYLAQAGENAMRRSAFVEATALLRSGLDQLAPLPDGNGRDALELNLQVPLGVSVMNASGFAAPEVERAFRRSYDLCRRVSNTSQRYRVLRGLWSFSVMSANLRAARATAEELLLVSEREGDVSGLVEGHRIMATTWFHLGNFQAALDHLERGIALYDPHHHSSHAFLFGQDPGVSCLCWHAVTTWHLGHPDNAVASASNAIDLARRIGHPFSLSYAMNFMAFVHQLRLDPAATIRFAAEAIRYAQEQSLAQMLAMGEVFHGWGRVLLGSGDGEAANADAVMELRCGLARWRSTGSLLVCPYWSALLASALDATGRPDDAMAVLDDAMAEAAAMDEAWSDGALYLLKGEFLAARAEGAPGNGQIILDAQHWLRRAVDTAEAMSAASVKLRAVARLDRLLRSPGSGLDAL
jgi:DNA-binding winged helix-turn-helix (wHTH) protein/tetratricopeptide (TPR) repeat protein